MPKDLVGICPKCSLPIELCVCESLAQEDQKITISIDKRKWGKLTTVINFNNFAGANLKKIAKKAKSYCASGGTVKGNSIEIQGDHRKKMKQFLEKLGYAEENIDII
ncbi:MAG: stress response translation initiation inhibitor YciH [Promethearchaeia archaeon]|nr:MAG: stress response translation initiation inhibitor YciH [Candidatus Lokiarchaeia archaeon]